jgi:N-acetylmuramoyl-L-alanine amidase
VLDSPHAHHWHPSPHHGERVGVEKLDMLILHYTGMASEDEALAWLCDPVSNVSAHYFIHENGHVQQLVQETRRAWHAGKGFWAGQDDINSCSIGIEIANSGHAGGLPAFSRPQISSLILLCRDIGARWNIPPQRVLAHSDIAPSRKQDPGEKFPWALLHEAGIGHWVRPAPLKDGRFFSRGDEGQPIEALQALFALYGYGLEINGVFDDQTRDVVTAFQRHFRQEQVDGVADASTLTTLRDLIALQPTGTAVA